MHGYVPSIRRLGDWWGILSFSIQHGALGFRIYLRSSLGPSQGLRHCCQSCCEASGHREGWRPGLRAHWKWYLIEAGRKCGCGCVRRKGNFQPRQGVLVHSGQANLKHWIGGPPGMVPFFSGLLLLGSCRGCQYFQSHPTSQPEVRPSRGSSMRACMGGRQAERLVVSLRQRPKDRGSGFWRC